MNKRGELHRIPGRGKIAGVCAGLAEYFGMELWLVRILFVSAALLMTGPFVPFVYIAAWFILDKKSPDAKGNATSGFSTTGAGKGWRNDDDAPIEVKTKVWQAGEPPRQAAKDIQARYQHIEERLRGLESYVTSKEFQLNREISRL